MAKNLCKLLVLLMMASGPVFAQTITGKVTSTPDGEAMPGVSVLVKGTTRGTTTDANGTYTVTASPSGKLVFSYIGYKTQEVDVANRSTIDVGLLEDASQLNEVVVTALGIKKEKKALGYAVQDIKGAEILKNKSSNVINSLSGKIAGVNVTQSSGAAGVGAW